MVVVVVVVFLAFRYSVSSSSSPVAALTTDVSPPIVKPSIGIKFKREPNTVFIVEEIIEDGPADKYNKTSSDKIQVGDYIMSINGTRVTGLAHGRFADLIKGEVGKSMTIEFRKLSNPSTVFTVTLKFTGSTDRPMSVPYSVGGSAYSTHAVSNISQKNRSMTNSNGKGKRKGKGKNKSKKQNATKKLNRH